MTAPTKTKPHGPRRPGRPAGPRKPKGAPRNPAKRPTNISDGALREAYSTLNREPRTIPASWWDESTAVNMAAYIEHRGADLLRKRFGGRK